MTKSTFTNDWVARFVERPIDGTACQRKSVPPSDADLDKNCPRLLSEPPLKYNSFQKL